MTDVETALSEGTELLDDLVPLLAVPVVVSLLNVSNLRTVIEHRGTYGGFTVPLPTPIGDLWTFVNTPGDVSAGRLPVTVDGSGELLLVALLAMAVYLVIESVLTAGYVGSIQQYRREGRYDFVANARRYWRPYAVLLALFFGALLLIVPLAVAVPGLFVVGVIGVLLGLYLFWGAWFLVPAAGLGPFAALGRSYRLATTERAYATWSLAYLALGAGLSLVLTSLVSAASFLGVLIALCVAVPAGFVLTVGSLRVIDDLSGPRAPPEPNRHAINP